MADTFISTEFLASDGRGRVKKCRQLANEVAALAAAASHTELRSAYLDLERQWNALADEIERAEKLTSPMGRR